MQLDFTHLRQHHLTEADRYLAIARNWTASAEAEARRTDGRANGVRRDDFEACARSALVIAEQHQVFAQLADGAARAAAGAKAA